MNHHDKVILSCALIGGAVTSKAHCLAIPYSPVEIAEANDASGGNF